jgi:hypothetical protein
VAARSGLHEVIMVKANANGSSTTAKPKSAKKPSIQEKIQLRAYEIYLERNGAPGDPLEDWVRAENELLRAGRKKARKLATKSI